MAICFRDEMVYRINADAIIVFIDENWDRFYQENTPKSQPKNIFLGTSLWKHISDPSTINLYQALIARARKFRQPLVFPFRCDAPATRRYMEMRLTSVAAGEIEFHTTVIREETRETVELLDAMAARSGEWLRMCSWCKRIPLEGDWAEVEAAVSRLQLFDFNALPRISHTICGTCEERFRRELQIGN